MFDYTLIESEDDLLKKGDLKLKNDIDLEKTDGNDDAFGEVAIDDGRMLSVFRSDEGRFDRDERERNRGPGPGAYKVRVCRL